MNPEYSLQNASLYDSETGISTTYYYDFTDRMMKYVEEGTGYSHSVGYEYDTINNLTSMVETINGVKHTTGYTYDKDNRVTAITTDGISESYTYDAYGRVSTKVTKSGSATVLTETYTYVTNSAGKPTGQVATHRTRGTGYDVTYSYTYDGNGNILSVSDGTYTTTYQYDSANQLIRENNQQAGKTYTRGYDDAGNLMSKSTYSYTVGSLETATEIHTVEQTYTDSHWGDLMTSTYDQNYTYDEIGNPIYDDCYDYVWKHGRQLASMTEVDTVYEMTYNVDGIRTGQKIYDSTTGEIYHVYSYVYNGSQLVQMTVDGATLYFTYDAGGTPQTVKYNGTVYYYVTNLQGDVTAILDGTGAVVVSYTYDAWGNHTSDHSGIGTLASTLGRHNPLRYRGYVYDFGTGHYYLQSRYYNPAIGRFINADFLVSTKKAGLGGNIFVYCNNNAINYCDSTGFDAIWIQESESAAGFGHSGLMVQDDKENWFFFYWGPESETPSKSLATGVPNGSYKQEIETDGADMRNTDTLCSTLAAAGGDAGKRASQITSTYYFEGDYTATLESMDSVIAESKKYNLLTKNCVQVTIDAFSASDSRFSMVAYGTSNLIPNLAAEKVAMMPSKKNSYPWKLLFYNIFFG